jgi:hypothetical protein
MKIKGDLHQIFLIHANEDVIDVNHYLPILPLTHSKFKIFLNDYINNRIQDNSIIDTFLNQGGFIRKRKQDFEIKGFELSYETYLTFICDEKPKAGVNCVGIIVIESDFLSKFTDNPIRQNIPNEIEKRLDLISVFADRRGFKSGVLLFKLDGSFQDATSYTTKCIDEKNNLRKAYPNLLKALNIKTLVPNYEIELMALTLFETSVLFALSKISEIKSSF